MKATEKQKQQMREQYQRVKNDIKPRKQQWYKDNKEKMLADYQTNKEKVLAYRREHNKKLRTQVINHYGGKCNCCGEQNYEFLAIDHINGGGNKQRKALGFSGNSVARYIIKNNYPQDFRILCHNCNCAIGFYGKCPHKNNHE